MKLVIGYGNTARSDDGVGVRLAERIDALKKPGIDTLTTHQLLPEHVEEFAQYKEIYFIDASSEGPAVSIRELKGWIDMKPSASHGLSPELLVQLSRKLGYAEPQYVLCSIRGENFEFGTELSPIVTERLDKAFYEIVSLLSQGSLAA